MSESEDYSVESSEEYSDLASQSRDEAEPADPKTDTQWGRTKRAYYDADDLTDEDAEKEEEQEALRLQRRRTQALHEADFVDEFADIAKRQGDAKPKGGARQEEKVERDFSRFTKHEIIDHLRREAPELEGMLQEYRDRWSFARREMRPLIKRIQKKGLNASEYPAIAVLRSKYALLINYLANISYYLCLRASGSARVKHHPVIATLLEHKACLESMEELERRMQPDIDELVSVLDQKATSRSTKADEMPHAKAKSDGVAGPEDGGSNDEDSDLGYYASIQASIASRKHAKSQAATDQRTRPVADDAIEPGSKRQIDYQILKNRGLMPRRSKEQRNPRVKRRKKFEKAQKRIKSIKRVVTSQEGAYGGEKTGIKIGLARSVRLG